MAKNKASQQKKHISQEGPALSDESLDQVTGGNQSDQKKGHGKGHKNDSNSPQLGDGSVRFINGVSDGTSNTIIIGES